MTKPLIKSNITQMLKQVLGVNVEFDGGMGARGGAIIIEFRRPLLPGEKLWEVPQEKWDAEGKFLDKLLNCPYFRVYRGKEDPSRYTIFYVVKGEIRGWVQFKHEVGSYIYMQFCNLREPASKMDSHEQVYEMVKKETA